MWTYDVYAIEARGVEKYTDEMIDEITSISAFSKYLGKPPMGIYPGTRNAFLLLDSNDRQHSETLERLGFEKVKTIEGNCECCRGTRTLEHEKDLSN
jgi:hypothetical protein